MEWLEPWSGDGLTLWFQTWLEGFISFLTVSLLAILAVAAPTALLLASGRTARRSFWCRLAGRHVEVEFDKRRPFGALLSVRACSAFESGDAIACRRQCVNASYRHQWEPAIPIVTRRGGAR